MAIKQRGAVSRTELEVDATPAAGRIIVYDASGANLCQVPAAGMIVPINTNLTANDNTSTVAMWAIRNYTPRRLLISGIRVGLYYDSTIGVASLSKFTLRKVIYTQQISRTTGRDVVPSYANSKTSGLLLPGAFSTSIGGLGFGGTAVLGASLWAGVLGRVARSTTAWTCTMYSSPGFDQMVVELAEDEALALYPLVGGTGLTDVYFGAVTATFVDRPKPWRRP